jgi:hypothetical protein
MRDALVTVIEALRDELSTLGTGKIFIGPPQVEQTGADPYWVLDILNLEPEHMGPATTEYRAEIGIYRVAKPPTGRAGDEAKLAVLSPLFDVRTWATDLIELGYVLEPRSLDVQIDRDSDEQQIVAAMTISADWQECA